MRQDAALSLSHDLSGSSVEPQARLSSTCDN